MSTPIRFFHRGEIISLEPSEWPDPTRSVLDWLRTSAGCMGTKEGCNEGDCGACTVAVADLADTNDPQAIDGLRWRTVNACLQFLPTLDGRALMTVEDLRGSEANAPLHPVQQAMVEGHGSQCGFCTPGFVMSLWALYEQHLASGGSHPPDRQTIADALAGNLCRCTGYRPILDAAVQMFEHPARRLDARPIVAALQAIRGQGVTEPTQLASVAAPRGAPSGAPAGLSPRVPVDPRAGAPGARQSARWFAPRNLDEFAQVRQSLPDARLLAGGTDIGLWVNKQFRDLGDVLYIGQVAALRHIETLSLNGMQTLRIGAAVSLEAGWAALCEHWPTLNEMRRRFASPAVRHAGTLVGNLANGSPIGDSAPVLMALDASLELRQGDALRIMPLHGFYTGYMRNLLQPGEFVQAVRVPLPQECPGLTQTVRAYKISKRFDCDISAVSLGAFLQLEEGRITEVRLAWGGLAATVQRAAQTEAVLRNVPWDEAALRAAQAALAQDFQPLTDLRGSAEYRANVSRGLLHRLWLQTRPDDPLDDAQTRVHSATGVQ